MSLGCEHITPCDIQKEIGEYEHNRIRFLCAQDVEDEIKEGCAIVQTLAENAAQDQKVPVDIADLVIGMKCGGSDAFSGITANPLIGRVSDMLVAEGATVMITETAEMFGAEPILLNRCINDTVYKKTLEKILAMREYFRQHCIPVDSNPSPGNVRGGITTLEDKSLGCIQKGGTSPVVDMLDYAESVKSHGLNLLNGPSNDLVSVTNLAAAGAHLVIFSTGRGTPFGGIVPTMKVSTNSSLSDHKPEWIDFDAGRILTGSDPTVLAEELFMQMIDTINGDDTKNERNHYHGIAIFKDGVSG